MATYYCGKCKSAVSTKAKKNRILPITNPVSKETKLFVLCGRCKALNKVEDNASV